MTPQDKKHAIVLALQTWPERSTRMIAEQAGCDHSYVVKLKPSEVVTDSPPARVTGKDGKRYPASRPSASTPRSSTPASESATTERRAEPRRDVRPPSNGMQFARIAPDARPPWRDGPMIVAWLDRNGRRIDGNVGPWLHTSRRS